MLQRIPHQASPDATLQQNYNMEWAWSRVLRLLRFISDGKGREVLHFRSGDKQPMGWCWAHRGSSWCSSYFKIPGSIPPISIPKVLLWNRTFPIFLLVTLWMLFYEPAPAPLILFFLVDRDALASGDSFAKDQLVLSMWAPSTLDRAQVAGEICASPRVVQPLGVA
jgi:hypothetical protein